MSTRRLRATATVLLAVMGGCASGGPGDSSQEPVTTAPGTADPALDPGGLQGNWRVIGEVAGDTPTWLRLAGGEMTLWHTCGDVLGHRTARDGALVVLADGWAEDRSAGAGCGAPSVGGPQMWVTHVAAYEPVEEGWLLRDLDGAALATLVADDGPPGDSRRIRSWWGDVTGTPSSTGMAVDRTPDPTVLPSGTVRVASTTSSAGGSRSASSPRNPSSRTARTAPGAVPTAAAAREGGGRARPTDPSSSSSDGTTLMVCDGEAVDWAFTDATWAVRHGAELVLLDVEGVETARLVRA